jgi:hypothetical protein
MWLCDYAPYALREAADLALNARIDGRGLSLPRCAIRCRP